MAEKLPSKFELLHGPQDGARVKAVGGAVPTVIYVAKKSNSDGYQPYGSEQSKKFPVCYELDVDCMKYRHKNYE